MRLGWRCRALSLWRATDASLAPSEAYGRCAPGAVEGARAGAPAFLVESCLLTFGLASVSGEELAKRWYDAGLEKAAICWVQEGEIMAGTMEE